MERFAQAARYHAEGKLEDARRLYRQVLRQEPQHFGALNNLGVLAFCERDLATAQIMLERAAEHPGHNAVCHGVLAATLLLAGAVERAEIELNKANRLDPHSAEPFYFVGLALRERGASGEAIACLERALRLNPGHAGARNDLGVAYLADHRLAEARACFEQVAGAMGLANLAQVCREERQWEQGANYLKRAIAITPGNAVLWSNLASFLLEDNRSLEALECAERAVRLGAKFSEGWVALGNAQCRLGRHEEAARAFEKAATLHLGNREFQQNLLFMRHYCAGISPQAHAEEHRKWARRFAPPGPPRDFPNSPDPGRKLRVGYVSGDLRAHPVAYFMGPVLEAHDPQQVETFCYAAGPGDAWTARVRGAASYWRDTGTLDDVGLEKRILADGIDILIDLSGHTPGNRLPVFARRVAPVQASWLGYFNTTGVAAMDYVIADAQLAPPHEECPFTEEPLRIDGCYLTWQMPSGAAAAARPARTFTTYGCFSKAAKAGMQVVETWAEILKQNPTARLVMKNKAFADDGCRSVYRAYFERFGIAEHRVDLLGPSPYDEYLRAVADVDIVLDTFPYSGATTTCEALSAGVPVITLRGDRFVGRLGATVMHSAGLTELIAESRSEYIRKAVELGRIEDLRDRVAGSALCDTVGFTRKLEGAYREIWERWCKNACVQNNGARDPQADPERP